MEVIEIKGMLQRYQRDVGKLPDFLVVRDSGLVVMCEKSELKDATKK